jgi:heavy metal sensor kinase
MSSTPSSLRARLLAWYSLILLAVIATFGVTVGYLLWRSMVAELDARLRAGIVPLAQGLRPAADGGFNLDLPLEYQPSEAGDADAGTYYAIWTAAGEIIDRSSSAADVPVPDAPGLRTRAGRRELTMSAADGALVLVGDDLEEARAAVRSFAGTAAVGGAAALLVSLAGGWFLVGRALSPIGRINRAAAAMAAGDLNARIEVQGTENELEHVAHALNDAFDRLQRALDAQRRFTADASHELRTPLATLAAETEWALARPRSDDEYRETVATVRRAADRMTRIVDRLLTLARADHDAIPLERQPVPLETVVHDAVTLVQPVAARRGITLETKLATATVEGDRERLTELMTNLCSNAVDYNRDGGRVTVELWPENGDACVRISDSGVGISAEDVPRIFERFYRPGSARDRRSGGAGLGLAIAKWIVDAHGGEITCTSTPGQGTAMLVRLPRMETTEATEGTGSTQRNEVAENKQRHAPVARDARNGSSTPPDSQAGSIAR